MLHGEEKRVKAVVLLTAYRGLSKLHCQC